MPFHFFILSFFKDPFWLNAADFPFRFRTNKFDFGRSMVGIDPENAGEISKTRSENVALSLECVR